MPVPFGILEVEADTVTTQRHIRKAAKGRHDIGRNHSLGSRQVEAIRPLVTIVRVLQAGQVLLPDRVSGIKVAAQAEADIEIGVLQESACQGQSGEGRDFVGTYISPSLKRTPDVVVSDVLPTEDAPVRDRTLEPKGYVPVDKLKLEIKERFGVHHAVRPVIVK